MRSAPKDFPTCMTLTIGMYFHSYTIMYSFVTIQQGVPRGLAGPLAGCGVSPPSSPTLPPEAVPEQRNLNSYKIAAIGRSANRYRGTFFIFYRCVIVHLMLT